ncbi:DNA sulfur modification protein DndD [Methanohalophilus euhalobius]|uniref:DNA sulfur modification protein DndD n=1 Tax=Methanohalophilus euhalobius TaxID=51203 RepID=A0A285F6T5_9EURY|nr:MULTISPECIES: AAA family ATPase [Methanohalophilus]ODV49940.1 MAG: hypothetical protein A8273_599 [Methanohalophilus sp. 2-GBenrich]RXG34880.1 hypothetical protein CI957_474 [Methanohalophilus sp. WG1-DM]TCL12363.1 DNA sulfur modification protein DndD [Methanohalophilus euhalobius]SNY06106.1 DNA sulfur modification protein DndD [Methanohalophilus euhalobius]
MRIEKVAIQNYRQHINTEILFKKFSSNDLHIIVGENGTGKTNILNAINWCLYGEEPHISNDSKKLPLFNLKAVEELYGDEDLKVAVEVWVETDEEITIIFSRNAIYKKPELGKNVDPSNINFDVKIVGSDGNTQIHFNEKAASYVGRFVPKDIREFFFFDGERLDQYFKEATGQNIRHAIFEISQIDLLENRLESKLDDCLSELRREAGKKSPKIEETRKSYEEVTDKIKDTIKEIDTCKQQIEIAQNQLQKCDENLRGVPDVSELQERVKELDKQKIDKKSLYKVAYKEKQELLFEVGILIRTWPAIKKTIAVIEEKKNKGELPPTYDKDLLLRTIEDSICKICGNPLNENTKTRVNKLLNEITLSTQVAHGLQIMEAPLFQIEQKLKRFQNKFVTISEQIKSYDGDLTKIENELEDINKKIGGYNLPKIKEWHQEQTKFKGILENETMRKGVLQKRYEGFIDEQKRLNEELDKEIEKGQKAKELKTQIDFCKKSYDVVKSTKQKIMNNTREQIEAETKAIFFELLWKKTTFKDVKINDDYSISLIHFMDYECLGSISAGERELLALAFTLALHKVSGFDSPILIDTPVARISSKHRENFGIALANISENKQTILLFTPDEYSENISQILNNYANTHVSLKMSSDEKETLVRGI